MAINILMPALSPTMTEGTLARWLKKEGDTLKAGDVIAEIETDKATMEVEAVDEGVLGRILVADGTAGVKVNEPIAVLLMDGESAGAAPAPATQAAAPAAAAAPTPVAAEAPEGGCGSLWRPREPDFRFAVGAADGEAGWDRSFGDQGQRAEWADHPGGYRGGAEGRGCCGRRPLRLRRLRPRLRRLRLLRRLRPSRRRISLCRIRRCGR